MKIFLAFLFILSICEIHAVTRSEDRQRSSEESYFFQLDGSMRDLRYSALVAESYDYSRATAFFAKIRNKNFLITNLKVKGDSFVKTFQLIDGRDFKRPERGFVAKNKDVYIMPVNDKDMPNDYLPLPVSASINEFVKVGDNVKVIGAHSSDGVLRVVDTFIDGIASQKLTLRDQKFSAGSLGSPVIHEKSGMCIGIVTCDFIRVSERGKVDRDFLGVVGKYEPNFYVARIDNIKNWTKCGEKDLELINETMTRVSLNISYMQLMIRQMEGAGSSFEFNLNSAEFKDINTICWECAKIISEYNLKIKGNGSNRNYEYPHAIVKKARREFFNDIKRLVLPLRNLLLSSRAEDVLPDESKQLRSDLNLIQNRAQRMEYSPQYR